MSVSAFAVRELTELSRRADNPDLLGDLPDSEVRAEDILGRSGRGPLQPVVVIDASAAVQGLLTNAEARRPQNLSAYDATYGRWPRRSTSAS